MKKPPSPFCGPFLYDLLTTDISMKLVKKLSDRGLRVLTPKDLSPGRGQKTDIRTGNGCFTATGSTTWGAPGPMPDSPA